MTSGPPVGPLQRIARVVKLEWSNLLGLQAPRAPRGRAKEIERGREGREREKKIEKRVGGGG